MARHPKVEISCDLPACGKTFLRAPSLIKAHNFCSKECKQAWVNLPIGTRICENVSCGKEFTFTRNTLDKRFCDKSCGATAQHYREKQARAEMETRLTGLLPLDNEFASGVMELHVADLSYDPFSMKF